MNDWIEWPGGDCPVGGDVMVEVRLRDGRIVRRLGWPGLLSGYLNDIIAYRVVESATPCPWQPGQEYPLRDGGAAHIYCTDAPGEYPIHGRINSDWYPVAWDVDGRVDHGENNPHDLLPPRAERVAYLYRGRYGDTFASSCPPDKASAAHTCVGSAIVREGEFHDR